MSIISAAPGPQPFGRDPSVRAFSPYRMGAASQGGARGIEGNRRNSRENIDRHTVPERKAAHWRIPGFPLASELRPQLGGRDPGGGWDER